jgi:hypothetical protein
MLVEAPPPPPFAGAVWIGGYWVWEGNWVWAAGRWAAPPQPGYLWVHPYYEYRDGFVVFITGHWHAPNVAFVPPPRAVRLTVVAAAPGVARGPAPLGPPGVFVPAPPGSRAGIIVPAPLATPPAVVIGAPPVVSVGMRVQIHVNRAATDNAQIANVTYITNVTVVAPAAATANGKAFESAVPAHAHLAAALPPVVHMPAPVPTSTKPIPAFVPGRGPVALPPPQTVRALARPAAPQAPAAAAPPGGVPSRRPAAGGNAEAPKAGVSSAAESAHEHNKQGDKRKNPERGDQDGSRG